MVPSTSTRAQVIKYGFDPSILHPLYATKPAFGHLPGLYVGKTWQSRMGAAWDGTHLSVVARISGKEGMRMILMRGVGLFILEVGGGV